MHPAALVGGGLAGLTAAAELRRHGVPVVVFEAGRAVAGLAASHHDEDGFTYDTGAHFITNRLATALGMNAACRPVQTYGESVALNGTRRSYPFGLLAEPRFVASALAERIRPRPTATNAAERFRREYGPALADTVAIPLLEAWSGASAHELSPAVADKLPTGLLHTMWLRLAGRISHRAVAAGYSSSLPENASVWHVYPVHGVGALLRRLAEEVADAIRLESPVERILVEDGRATAVQVHGQVQPVSLVISTAPIHILPRLVEGTDRLDRFRRFRFRPMISVNLKLEGRHLLPDTVLWIPERTSPFFRLTEATRSMPWLAPEGKTMVTADLGAEVGDEHWRLEDATLARLCLDQLEQWVPGVGPRFLGSHVVRIPVAYPVFLNRYETDRQSLDHGTGVANLLSLGRNGEFGHWLMEDVYWRTLRRVRRWIYEEREEG